MQNTVVKMTHNKSSGELTQMYETMCEEKMKRETKNNIRKTKTNTKINDENIQMPLFSQEEHLLSNNYNLQQLKQIAKHYKLKLTGNKKQLVLRLYTFLSLSGHANIIQRVFRGNVQRKFNEAHGPAWKNRSLCVNSTDFLTMDEIQALPHSQFFSYKDKDGFIYGFDTISMYNLIYKADGVPQNPYNRNEIPTSVIIHFRKLIRLGRILNSPVAIKINNVENEISEKKNMELKIVDVFQKIDALGNYSNPKWFMDLKAIDINRFMRYLMDIWVFRAHLDNDTRRLICPPTGNPFNHRSLENGNDIHWMRKNALETIEKLVNSATDKDNKCLGAYYVLGALTLVNFEAACSLPVLYQAFQI